MEIKTDKKFNTEILPKDDIASKYLFRIIFKESCALVSLPPSKLIEPFLEDQTSIKPRGWTPLEG